MKLLIITQKVDINDDNLGFFHRWLEKFSKKLDKLYVICLLEGEYHLPENVLIYSLGEKRSFSKFRRFFRLQKFLFKNLKDVDGVFIHMCPIYAIAAFPLTKIFRKKMILWYLHKSVNPTLKLAQKCVDKILTASPESCRLKDRNKIEVIGHGIDTDFFKSSFSNSQQPPTSEVFKIFSPGRISPIKGQKTLIQAIDILVNEMNVKDIELQIAGTSLEDYEKEYLKYLKNLVKEKKLENFISFLGSIPYTEMPKYYQNSDLVVNLSLTGSVDKVVLEAMASGCLVLTCNEAFENILDNKYLFKNKDFIGLAEKIINLKTAPKDESLRKIVIKDHNLDNLIDKILQCFT